MNIKVGTVYIDVEPDVSKFTEKLRRKLQDTDLGKVVEQTINQTSRAASKLGKDSDRASVSLDKIGDRTSNFNNKMLLLRNSISLLKFPAVFAGLGLIAQALVALAAGAIAVVAALGPLAGLVAAIPAGLLAIGAATTTVKLGFKGIAEEIKATQDPLDATRDKLTAAGHEFVQFLRAGVLPLKEELQRIAQSNLLPGIQEGIQSAFSADNVGSLKTIIADTANSLGGLATKLGQALRNPALAQGLLTISETSTMAFDAIGESLIRAGAGFGKLLLAAQPLVRWLSDVIAKGLELVGIWAGNAAASGKAAKFFQETADITSLLGTILGRLFSVLVSIGKAAYPLGKVILVALNEELAKLRDWAQSASGQSSLKSYFESSLPVLRSFVLLAADLVKTIFLVGQAAQGSGLTGFFDQIRTEVLPLFQGSVEGSATLGQALLDITVVLAKVGALFMSTSGPLTLFVTGLAKAAKALGDLLSNNALLAEFVTTFASLLALSKLFNLTKVISSIMATVASLQAQAAATGVATSAQMRLNYAMRANVIGIIATAIQLLVVGFILLYKHSETFRGAVQALFRFLQDVGVVVLKVLTFNFKIYLRVMEAVIGAASHLPIVGDKFKGVADKIRATREILDKAIAGFENLGKASGKAGNEVEAAASKSKGAIASLGTVLQGRLTATQKTLGTIGQSLTSTFTDFTSKAMKAFDAETTSLLASLTVKVEAYGKSWLMKDGDLTPAERELKALNEAEAKRSKKRQRADLQKQLRDAKFNDKDLVVDGKIISHTTDLSQAKQIQEQIRQLDVDDRRTTLEARAVVERKAADKALRTGQTHLQEQREIQKENFQKELTALQNAIAKGKLTQENARNATLALLKKYGVPLQAAGRDLGKAFSSSLNKSMQAIQKEAGKTNAALTRILALRKQIDEYDKAKADAKGRKGGPLPGLVGPVGLKTPPGLQGPVGGTVIGQHVDQQIVVDDHAARQIGNQSARKVHTR